MISVLISISPMTDLKIFSCVYWSFHVSSFFKCLFILREREKERKNEFESAEDRQREREREGENLKQALCLSVQSPMWSSIAHTMRS